MADSFKARVTKLKRVVRTLKKDQKTQERETKRLETLLRQLEKNPCQVLDLVPRGRRGRK